MATERAERVSLATPAGRGAVATIVVAGTRAVAWADELLRPVGGRGFGARPPRTPVFGRWPLASGACEEVVACRTSDEQVEVHCHGGPVAASAIIATLAARGAVVVPWEELADSSPGDSADSESLVAVARRALADCRTPRAALVLLDQLSGAWTRQRDELARFAAVGRWESLARRCETLLELAPLGAHLARPWRVALAGRPNAGKSSLANALAGFERAIVSPAPGTTRDALSVELALDGWPVELVDTAGVRSIAERVEAAGVRRAIEVHATADLVLVVADASAPWTDAEERLLADHPRALVVHAKADLAPPPPDTRADALLEDRPGGCLTSVRTGAGLPELIEAIVARLVRHAPAPGEAVPLTARQCERLRELRAASESADAAGVARVLAELTR